MNSRTGIDLRLCPGLVRVQNLFQDQFGIIDNVLVIEQSLRSIFGPHLVLVPGIIWSEMTCSGTELSFP